ncbi:MAG: hypothetical protein QW815_03405, partial [Nitrososphaerota archaeon]
EKSGTAFRYLLQNIKLNKVGDRVTALLGDASTILKGLPIAADRVIMNLPHQSINYLSAATEIVRDGGVIHLYTVERSKSLERAVEIIHGMGRRVSHVSTNHVKEISPRESILRLDLRL